MMEAIFSGVSDWQKERYEKGAVAMEGNERLAVDGGNLPWVKGGKSGSKEDKSRKNMVCRIA